MTEETQNETQTNNGKMKFIYIIAAVAGAALIIYGAVFYTKPPVSEQSASIASQNEERGEQKMFEDQILGSQNAPVTIIEYGSYLCGHCVTFGQTTFKDIKKDYIETGKAKFIYRSYPPLELGMANGCAYEQGKYWQYHEYLIENTPKSEDDLAKFAGSIGLNESKFKQCLQQKTYQTQAEKWYQQGVQDGIEGTPTFLINGKSLVGNLPYSEFQKAIDEALASAQK